jgi:hypothetical protein
MEKKPAGQSVQEDAPELLFLPAAQFVQWTVPTSGACFPASQFTHSAAAASLYLPNAQSPQAVEPAELNLPASQMSHSDWAVPEYVPGAHEAQAEEPSTSPNMPAAQSWHSVRAVVGANLPTTQISHSAFCAAGP